MVKNNIEKVTRYKLYGIGVSYLSVCSLALGFTAGMWGIPVMVAIGGVMVVVGALGVETYRRKTSVQKVSEKVSVIADTQSELIDDITQMRKLEKVVKVTHITPKKVSVPRAHSSSMTFPILNAVKNADDTITYSEAVTEELILNAINNASVDVFMQPVVRLPQRRIAMMEVFARLRAGNGQSLTATQYMGIAKRKGLQVRLDNLLLRQGLETIRKDVDSSLSRVYMLNIEANTLMDGAFMKDLLSFLKVNARLASRLVFEVNQSALSDMKKDTRKVLQALSKLGCGVSMDQVEDPQIDRELIREIGVRYIKISGMRLKDFATSNEGVQVMRRIKQALAQDSVSLIADKIEGERILCEILDLEIDYGQGYLFGKPDRESVYDLKSRPRTA
jgi:cyclic-di-GMP phosphodiesterase TipF (flagellum assembly factor)